MLRLLGDLGEVVHKIDGVIELLELNGSGERFFFIFPLGTLFQSGCEIVGFQ